MTTISSLLLTILIGARVQRLPTVVGNGHGLLCSSLFNDRYTQTPQSYVIVANLTEGVLDSCAIQAYSEASFDAYVALGHGIDGYAGYPVTGTGLNPTCTGFNATVIGPQGGLTAGGTFYVLYVPVLLYQHNFSCMFSYAIMFSAIRNYL